MSSTPAPAAASAIDRLVAQSSYWAATFDQGALHHRPSLGVLVVACMDARIDVYGVLGLEPGEAHVLRNAGGVVTQDVLRSIAISQRLLGTRSVMVVQHTGCGMATFTEDALRAQLLRETGARPFWAAECFDDVEASVAQGVERVRRDPFVPHTDDVRGFVYDVHAGSLGEVAAPAGRDRGAATGASALAPAGAAMA